MVDFFHRHAYQENILSIAFHHITQLRQPESFNINSQPASKQPKLILTYHPHVWVVKEIIFHHLPILKSDAITREVFPDGPRVIYSMDKNLKDLLVYSCLPKVVSFSGTSKCLRKVCLTCKICNPNSIHYFLKEDFPPKSLFFLHIKKPCLRDKMQIVQLKICWLNW